jgi:hypothetical protein
MKPKHTVFLAAAVALAFMLSSIFKPVKPAPPQQTIFDTALMMLKEFIVIGNDSNLGFKNFDELATATIRLDEGIDVYYLREDSLLAGKRTFEEELIPMGRKIYPVYAGNQLRSAITFTQTPSGWKPANFENAQEIDEYIADRHATTDPSKKYTYIVMPFIHSDIVMKNTAAKEQFLTTPELQVEAGADIPSANISPAIERDDFVTGLVTHMKKLHGQ